MPIVVKDAGAFKVLYDLPQDTNLVIAIGGRGGRKTYEVSKFIAYSCAAKKKRAVILRDEKALIKESILNEIWARYETANASGRLDQECIKNETELKDRKTGKTLLYTKGFRASSNDKKASLKGPSDIDLAVIEEGEDINDEDKYNTFVDGLRKEGAVIIIMLNTPYVGHFLIKRLFNAKQIVDGYFEISPKDIPGFVCIQTSYKDNPYLPAHIISNYEGYGDPKHHLYNPHYYFTSILGYASTGRKGQILTKVKPISRREYMALKLTEIYGQDFGTASPAALTGSKFEGNKVYTRLINYKPLPALEIGKLYSTLKFMDKDRIVCDYAEPDTIRKLKLGFKDLAASEYEKYPLIGRGFFVVPCPSKDIEARISLLTSMEIYCVEEDTEYWNEINNYCYAQDKYGNYTDSPIDDFNHAIDSLGYVVTDQRGKAKMFGV